MPLRTPTLARRACRAAALGVLFAGTLPGQSGPGEPQAEAMVFHAFPEADSYRRIVRDVDQRARTAIERQLPFRVHFHELGPHTLFVAFRGRQPVGVVYLRSEEAEWGLAEIAWALTLDTRVLGFQFQRGRSRHARALETSAFARGLVGRDLTRLAELIPAKVDPADVPEGTQELATTVLRSGTKALLVVDTVWRDEIAKLQDLAMGFDAFPTADRFHRRILRFDSDLDGTTQAVVASVVRATGRDQLHLGTIVRTDVSMGGDRIVLRWLLDEDLRVLKIAPARSWPNEPLRIACTELEGQPLMARPCGPNRLAPLAHGLGEALVRLDTTRRGR